MATKGGPHCSPSQARSSPESSSTDSSATSQRATYLKLIVASDLAAAPQTRCLPCDKYKTSASNNRRTSMLAVFIDMSKAFETVNRKALWVILNKLRCPRKFTTLVRLFHDNMKGQVFSSGAYTNSFGISNVVKQGCVLAPVLFNLFFAQVLHHAVQNKNLRVYIRYRTDGSLFDLRRLSAKTKTKEKLILEALFADDCALVVRKENHL